MTTPPASTTLSAVQPPRRLWVVWLLYFVFFLGVGAYLTYLNVYYRQAGLTGTQIGVINMAGALVGVVSMVLWGYVSDRTGRPRLLLAAGAVGVALVAQVVPLLHTFGQFFWQASLSNLLASALLTLVDGIALGLLGAQGSRYGQLRIGGSFGYILAAAGFGLLYDRTGLEAIFPIYGVCMGLFAALALLLPSAAARSEYPSRQALGVMVRQPAWVVFSICVFLVWIANYAAIQFLGVTLASMGASQSLIGVAAISGTVVEIPFMVLGGRLIQRFGLKRLLLVGMAFMVLRYTLLGWMQKPELAVLINLINGPAYAFYAVTIVAYARQLAPPSLAMTAQGLLNATMSLSGVVSAFTAGVLFDRVGPHILFYIMALCCVGGLGLFAASAWRTRRAALRPGGLPSS